MISDRKWILRILRRDSAKSSVDGAYQAKASPSGETTLLACT